MTDHIHFEKITLDLRGKALPKSHYWECYCGEPVIEVDKEEAYTGPGHPCSTSGMTHGRYVGVGFPDFSATIALRGKDR